MVKNTCGLDFGTYDLKIFDPKKKRIQKVKNAIAVRNKRSIIAVGDAAYAMRGKTPDFIQVHFPMKEGVIANFEFMQKTMQTLLLKEEHNIGAGCYLIAISPNMTEVETRAFVQLMGYSKVKVRSAYTIERGVAAAIGMDQPVLTRKGLFLVDLGGESCELSVISQGKVVLTRRLKIGGAHMDQAIANAIKEKHNFLVGLSTAEELRKNFGMSKAETKKESLVAGKDLRSGLPKMRQIPIDTVQDALVEFFEKYIIAIEAMLKRIPPDIRRMVIQNGITLYGGLANMIGIKSYFQERLSCNIFVPNQPELCVIQGVKKIIEQPQYEKLTNSMSDQNYRWLR